MILTRRTGWIGLDIGESTVKAAQVARDARGWRLAAAAIVPRSEAWPAGLTLTSPALGSTDEVAALRSLQPDLVGRRVAAVLPMAVCDVHSLDKAMGGDPRSVDAVRRAVETANQRSADDLEFDYWASGRAEDGRPEWTNAIAAPRSWSDRLCRDIAGAGWSCETIDGLPLALARAVAMVDDSPAHAPVAALDWGHGQTTFCVVEQGRPAYVRSLKNCGLRSMLSQLQEALSLSHNEAHGVLERHGLPGTTPDERSEACELLGKLVAEPLGRLEEEVGRSVAHYQHQRRAPAPARLYLFGGGATIKHVDTVLSNRLGLEARVWRLGDSDACLNTPGGHAACLFGAAAALSALAWEAS